MGEETCDIFETLSVPEPNEGEDAFRACVKALAEYFEPQKCVDHHVYVFRQQTQKAGENVNEFYTRLQLLARKCEFSNVDIEVKRQIIQGTSSLRLRRKAIEQSLSLEDLLKSAQAMETANEQTSEMEKQQLHAVGNHNSPSRYTKVKRTIQSRKQLNKTKCGLCRGNYPHQNRCPASSHIQVDLAIHPAAFFGAWMSRGVHARGKEEKRLTLVPRGVFWHVDVA